MKLWLLRPVEGSEHWEPWHDKAFGFVIRAETEEAARALAQEKGGDEAGTGYHRVYTDAWTNPVHSTCVEVTTEGPPEVILRDFASA